MSTRYDWFLCKTLSFHIANLTPLCSFVLRIIRRISGSWLLLRCHLSASSVSYHHKIELLTLTLGRSFSTRYPTPVTGPECNCVTFQPLHPVFVFPPLASDYIRFKTLMFAYKALKQTNLHLPEGTDHTPLHTRLPSYGTGSPHIHGRHASRLFSITGTQVVEETSSGCLNRWKII